MKTAAGLSVLIGRIGFRTRSGFLGNIRLYFRFLRAARLFFSLFILNGSHQV